MTTETEPTIFVCPICGKRVELNEYTSRNLIVCASCDLEFWGRDHPKESLESLIARWNKRAK